MKAKYGKSVVDVWKISLAETPEPWVLDKFEKGQVFWSHLPDSKTKFLQARGTAWGMVIGPPGYYLIFDGEEYRMITEREFKKDFILLGDEVS